MSNEPTHTIDFPCIQPFFHSQLTIISLLTQMSAKFNVSNQFWFKYWLLYTYTYIKACHQIDISTLLHTSHIFRLTFPYSQMVHRAKTKKYMSAKYEYEYVFAQVQLT